jgi:hypothetical protein
VATLTIRNISPEIVESLKILARRNRRSMEQEVRVLIEEHIGQRMALLEQIEEAWARQKRRPDAAEIETWIDTRRQ